MEFLYWVNCKGSSKNGQFPFIGQRDTWPHLYTLQRVQICPIMEYWCYIWAGSAKTSLPSNAVQKCLRSLVGEKLFKTFQALSQRHDVASLSFFYRYFHGRCSDALHQMVPPLKKFGRRTWLVNISHQYLLDIPKVKSKFHSQSFFPRTAVIWNSLPKSCFPDIYNLRLFKSKVNKFLSPPS